MMENEFSDKIKQFSHKITANFSVPGHKGGAAISCALKQDIFALDVTEFEETDDLSAPSGIIAEVQSRIAQIYGAGEAYMLVNGSTAGIHAMIMSACGAAGDGGKLIVDRHCHRSVINALILRGITPVFIERGFIADFQIYGAISPSAVEQALNAYPEAMGAIITSPTYYGICSCIASIAEILHSKGKFLLVDEAHGAHFPLSGSFPASALSSGADMAAVSVHKTLPCPTQTALLLVSKSLYEHTVPESRPRVRECINLVQTTSPSYILMTAMIEGILHTCNNREDMEQMIKYCREFTEFISAATDIKVLASSDPMRLVLNFSHTGINARFIAEKLWNDYGILYEMCDEFNVVFVVTSANTKKDLDILKTALLEIAKTTDNTCFDSLRCIRIPPVPDAKMVLTPREAFFSDCETVNLQFASGRVCTETVSACPPGTAITIPGQEIDQATIDYIRHYTNIDKIRVVRRG